MHVARPHRYHTIVLCILCVNYCNIMCFQKFIIVAALCKIVIEGKEFLIEAEDERTDGNHELLPYRNASDHKAVLVKGGTSLSINFCLRQRSFVTIRNIRYLNLKKSTLLNIVVNENLNYGSYFSVPNYNQSNVFNDTRSFSIVHQLEAGWNILKVYATNSIVLDMFLLEVNDSKLNNMIFSCKVICIQQLHFPPRAKSVVTPANMAQNSFFTKCAEVDNVDIPIYHPHVNAFSITARLPQYRTFANRRQANLTFCPHLTQTLWRFDNFSVTHFSKEMYGNFTYLTFQENNLSSIDVNVIFRQKGEHTGSINTDMGSQLFLKFISVRNDVFITLRYKHRNGSMITSERKRFSESHLEQMWKIPDYTWIETDYNYISLVLYTKELSHLKIDYLRLDRRPFIPDRTITLYKSDNIIIEGVQVDMWWRGHERMTINIHSGNSYEGFAFLRLYRPVPWTRGYSQVFILYQDGNARFLPVSPEGLDWIPFGTSVILGQCKHDSIRPYVSITQVDIYPDDMKLVIFFKEGGYLRMTLKVTEDFTQAYFDNIVFMNDTSIYPFVTVRSMYVEEGNTDVDSIKVDDVKTLNVIDNWGTVPGKSFAFHRRCLSRHLTLSPDIQIDILKT